MKHRALDIGFGEEHAKTVKPPQPSTVLRDGVWVIIYSCKCDSCGYTTTVNETDYLDPEKKNLCSSCFEDPDGHVSTRRKRARYTTGGPATSSIYTPDVMLGG